MEKVFGGLRGLWEKDREAELPKLAAAEGTVPGEQVWISFFFQHCIWLIILAPFDFRECCLFHNYLRPQRSTKCHFLMNMHLYPPPPTKKNCSSFTLLTICCPQDVKRTVMVRGLPFEVTSEQLFKMGSETVKGGIRMIRLYSSLSLVRMHNKSIYLGVFCAQELPVFLFTNCSSGIPREA